MKDNTERRKHTILSLYGMLIITLVMLVGNLFQYLLLEDLNAGLYVSDDRINTNDSIQIFIAILYLVLYIATAIFYLHWFRRAYYNIGKISRKEYTDGWAVGGWFVPIISFFYPYRIMKEIYLKTIRYIKTFKELEPKDKSINLIGWWWAFWLILIVFERFSTRFEDTSTIDGFVNATLTGMLGNIIGIVAVYLAIKVVENYAPMEDSLFKIYNIEKKKEALPLSEEE